MSIFVRIALYGGDPEILEVEDLKALRIEVTGGMPREAFDLGELGRIVDGYGWLNIEALRAAGGRASDPRWLRRFSAMVEFAMSRGWTSSDGGELRAHMVGAGPS